MTASLFLGGSGIRLCTNDDPPGTLRRYRRGINLWWQSLGDLTKRRQSNLPDSRPVDQADVETALTIRFRRRSIASSPTANTTITAANNARLSNRAPAIA